MHGAMCQDAQRFRAGSLNEAQSPPAFARMLIPPWEPLMMDGADNLRA